MSIEFSQIPATLRYPKNIKGKLSSLHSDVITYANENYDGSHDFRMKTICLLNTLTRYLIQGDALPIAWSSSKPFANIQIESDLTLKDELGELYINPKNVNWDVQPVKGQEVHSSTSFRPVQKKPEALKIKTAVETDKSDLYIQPPTVPQFDVDSTWASTVIDGTKYCIYTSIPVIPTKQNEISVTTNVDLFSESQLLRLYPLNFIKTRSPVMYESVPGLSYHSQLGLLLPIEGYTSEEIIDNVIRYPHLFKLSKLKDGEAISFYNTVEIDGELQKISDVWKELPDTSKIPYTADFVKEYVVRRYLLERDIKGVFHKYPMFGELDPYLTLFSTASDYVSWGHTDVIEIAKQCVKSRVSYKRSRNPVLRRIEMNV